MTTINADLVQYITEIVLKEIQKLSLKNTFPVGISARHVHLSQKELELLFGKDAILTHLKDLSQPGQFAANELVELVGPKGTIQKVRVLGPLRPNTQIEITLSDARKLGVTPPVRGSGDIEGTPGLVLRGPKGEVQVDKGVIIAERHVHFSLEDAKEHDIKDGEKVRVFVEGPKSGIMEGVTVRVNKNYALDFHIDTDDANAFGLMQGQRVKFEKYKNK